MGVLRGSGARFGVALLLLAGLTCGASDGAGDGKSGSRTLVARTAEFEFHSDPWINLHHFLYQWSRADEGLGRGRQKVEVPERADLSGLPEAERAAWSEAVAFYRKSVASLDHFNDKMLEEKSALVSLGGDTSAEPPDLIPGIAPALARAMPVYISRWWPAHDKADRAWIDRAVPLIGRHEARYLDLTRRIYDSRWDEAPRRVDASAYANFRGGYTAEGHPVMFTTDKGNDGLYGVEIFFHEIQHSRAAGSRAREELAAAFEAAGAEIPRNMWHALIFATAGEFARSIAEMEKMPEHQPYWLREGFDTFGGWKGVVAAANEHWLPVVRGERTRAEGFAALARSFKKP